MSSLPPLPNRADGNIWAPQVQQAVQNLSNAFRVACDLLSQGNYDVHRVQLHLESLRNNAIPLLYKIAEAAPSEGIPLTWVLKCSDKFHNLLEQLHSAELDAQGVETSHVGVPNPVTLQDPQTAQVNNRGRGRPRKVINAQLLQEAMHPSRRISQAKLAKLLGIHRHTLRKRLHEEKIDYRFSDLSDHDLDQHVKEFRVQRPESGRRYLVGALRRSGLRIQHQRVVSSLNRVDRLGKVLRWRKKISRRQYHVARPNALWHIDGHHKLILWGIVIHGVVDGYSRTVAGLRASTNNKASTVLKMFVDAVLKYGLPSRVRGDRGGENRDVSILMILLRGLNRASFMWGSSTSNTRVERIWVEVGSQFCRRWRGFFFRLERLHHLDRHNSHHLWLLHFLFLDLINEDCVAFQEQWNSHPISGEGHEQSPEDLRFTGQLQHGIYMEELNDPQVLERFQNIVDRLQSANFFEDDDEEDTISDGEPMDEDEDNTDSWEDIDDELDQVNRLHQQNISHSAVATPKHALPFESNEAKSLFADALEDYVASHKIPAGYGILPSEWENGNYPTHEIICTGRKASREHHIALPDSIWRPRAELWVQALHILNQVLVFQAEGRIEIE
ncbi:hypothetical protein H0H93_016422 [Arthromyces matolae]|nr:hypothetical protein H0H93_016422 [Arthromyces matolae]